MGTTAEAALPRLIEALREQDGEARAAVLGPSFLLRGRDGRVEDATMLGDGFDRLCRAIADGEVKRLGTSYLLASPDVDGADGAGVWLVNLVDARIGAAFEFARRAEAVEAVPPNVRDHSALEVVRKAIWAFVERDLATLMPLLTPNFAYTDSVRGTTLSGASQVVNGLLLSFPDLAQRGLADLELTELTNEIVQAQGVLTRSLGEDPAMKWRWRTISAVVDGRLKWAVREPDLRVAEA